MSPDFGFVPWSDGCSMSVQVQANPYMKKRIRTSKKMGTLAVNIPGLHHN